MKLVFVSNYFNHHQKPFCEVMYQKFGSDFMFVSTSVMREERRKLGYSQDAPDYVLLAHEDEQQYNKAAAWIRDADVVIAGAAPDDMLLERIRDGKLLLRYAERPYKKEAFWLKKLYHFYKWHQRDLWKKNVYMLCASAYTADDCRSIGMYKNRMYKWGYFPTVKKYDIDELFAHKKRDILMWCGRFIDWKHPENAIHVARKLKEKGYDFQLNMVGTGVMEDELKMLVEKLQLSGVVHFLGSMPSDQVRTHMEEAGIYLFTSDRQEGWGAVLNESMNSGCAVVACHAIGSVPFLVKNRENGLIYENGNVEDLFEKVKYLLDNQDEQSRMGGAAYRTITEMWNAEFAAERLLKLIDECMNHGSCDLFEEGPCSRAEIIAENI